MSAYQATISLQLGHLLSSKSNRDAVKKPMHKTCQRYNTPRCFAGQDRSAGNFFIYNCNIAVRDYELDQYGVVNNAVYLQYLLHVRHEWLRSLNINADAVARSGNALALSEIHIQYKKPLRSGDVVKGSCQYLEGSPARIVVEQLLTKLPESTETAPEEVLRATATIVTLNQDYKPKRFPPDVVNAFKTGQPVNAEC